RKSVFKGRLGCNRAVSEMGDRFRSRASRIISISRWLCAVASKASSEASVAPFYKTTRVITNHGHRNIQNGLASCRIRCARWHKDDGYRMIQWSVYVRPCVSFARQETHIDRLKRTTPPEGSVRAIFVTRAQWERSFIIHGSPAIEQDAEDLPEQIQLW